MQSFDTKFSKDQKYYLDFLVKKYVSFTPEQNLYINYQLKENKVKEGSNYLLESVDWFTIVQEYEECPKDIIKDFIDQEFTLSEYTKWLSTQPKINLGLGVPGAGSCSTNTESAAEEKKEEKKEEVKVIFFSLFSLIFSFCYINL